jgi:hypothetical protein
MLRITVFLCQWATSVTPTDEGQSNRELIGSVNSYPCSKIWSHGSPSFETYETWIWRWMRWKIYGRSPKKNAQSSPREPPKRPLLWSPAQDDQWPRSQWPMTKRSNFCCFSEILIANLEVEPKNYFKRFTLRNLKPLNTSEFLSWSFFYLSWILKKDWGFYQLLRFYAK